MGTVTETITDDEGDEEGYKKGRAAWREFGVNRLRGVGGEERESRRGGEGELRGERGARAKVDKDLTSYRRIRY